MSSAILVEAAAVVAAFTALSILMTWPLVTEMGRALPGDLGDPLLVTWTLAWVADRLPHGLNGVWHAPIYFPYSYTLAFSEHLIGVAVFTAPLQWFTGNPVLVYNATFVGSYVLAGSGMYLLVRDLTGRRDVAFIAGLCFAFVPYRAARISHLQVLMSGWMPIALWALHRYFARGSRRMLLAFAAVFLVQGLSNGYFLLYFALAVLVVCAVELVSLPWRTRALGELAVAAVLVGIVLLPVVQAYRAAQQIHGFERSRDEQVMYGADLADWGRTTALVRLWGPALGHARPERELFPGVMLVLLAGAAFWPRRGGSHAPDDEAGRFGRVRLVYGAFGATAFLVAFGPEPSAWDRTLLSSGPYDWLRAVVPGFDGLRVPARMAMLVYLSLAVLAGLGALRLLERLRKGARTAAALVLGVAVLAEGAAVPIVTVPFDDTLAPHERAAYDWLRDQPRGGVLELPLGAWASERTLRYQYRTLAHGQPIVSGYSGYGSALQDFLWGPVLDWSDAGEMVRVLQAAGIRYVVVHGEAHDDPADARAVVDALSSVPAALVERRVFGPTAVFALRPAEWAPEPERVGVRPVPRAAMLATASHNSGALERALDGDPESRWLSGEPQTGREWIRLELNRTRALASLRLGLAPRSWGDYPRRLVVEAEQDDGRVTLFEGPVLALMVDDLLRGSGTASIEIPLPPHDTQVLWIRQTGGTPSWYWSVHDITVYERDPAGA